MTDYNINVPPEVYNDHFIPYLGCNIPLQILFGGAASGKSKFIAQRCVGDLLDGGRNYLVLRNIANTINTSVFNELQKVITEWEVEDLFKINQSKMEFTCANGYQALCKGLDDTLKLKSITPKKGVITDIWVEEATETMQDDLKQLDKRLRGWAKVVKRMVLSFNPIMKIHWIFKQYFNGRFFDGDTLYKDSEILIDHSTYKDNRFLTQQDIEKLENEKDEYYYNVYTLGNWGVLGDVILKNWEVKDIPQELIATFDNIKNGLDFGFASNPMAYNRTHYHKNKKIIYIFKELNALGLTNPQIAKLLKPVVGGERVVCDSAEPKSIQELKNSGEDSINAVGAVKGKDSVNFGIQWLQQQHIIIDRSCQNTINECQLYQWKKNKAGETLPIPVDKNNHHIDELRYQLEDEMANTMPGLFFLGKEGAAA